MKQAGVICVAHGWEEVVGGSSNVPKMVEYPPGTCTATVEHDGLFVDIMASHDASTLWHMRGVGTLAMRLARRLRLAHEAVERIGLAGWWHDVGKLAVPRKVLCSARTLDAEQWAVMRDHVAAGAALAALRVGESIARIVVQHHEALDGSGYPEGLKGRAIPLESRIVTVADVFDALCRERPYKAAVDAAHALEVVVAGRDRKWDGEVIDALLIEVQEAGW